MIVAVILIMSYTPPDNPLPDTGWTYFGGVSDFGALTAHNGWWQVHCEIKDYWMAQRPGAVYLYDIGSNYFVPIEEGLTPCEYMSTRHQPVQFLPMIFQNY